MGPRKRVAGPLLVSMTLVATVLSGSDGAAAGPPAPGGSGGSGGPGVAGSIRHVTLVTGDRVTVSVRGDDVSVVDVTAGAGRGKVSFGALRANGHLRVVPGDAWPLLRADRLDPRLFDITSLVEFGYDDRRAELPLIVTGEPAAVGRRVGGMTAARTVRAVPGGSAFRTAKPDLPALWRDLTGTLAARSTGVSKLWLDGLRSTRLDQSVPQIGAPAAWAAGYTGTGVKVAVVDSGIDTAHPDLAGRVVAERDFTGSGDTLDRAGHGTHVAATIGSNDSRYRGVAPGAQLLSAKVCGGDGFCADSAILAGMQWAAEQGAKVINMSLGGPDGPEQDPLESAVETLTASYGALFVVAAGNAGGERTIGSPGSATSALTVGAVTKTDVLAGFSSRGPRKGDDAIKPDITAPGVDIVAARSKDGALGTPGASHLSLSGTSMATPHVAGAAAILLQQHPTWTPAQLKEALMGSANPAASVDPFGQGAGRVDVARAVTQTVLADPPSAGFGLQRWPHTDDRPLEQTITYRNTGDSDVTLQLGLAGTAPAGVFTLSANAVTVPARGSASVVVTADTRGAVPAGRYTDRLVATAGASRVGVPVAVEKEAESYDVTLHHLDRAGQPTGDSFTGLVDPATGQVYVPDTDGETIRVLRGRYIPITGFNLPDGSGTLLIDPAIVVDRDTTATFDARNGRPVSVTTPLPDAATSLHVVTGGVDTPDGPLVAVVFGGSETTLYAGSADPNHRDPAASSTVFERATRNGAEPEDSPYVAQLMWHEAGRMFQGFTRRVSPRDLATVDATHASEFAGTGLLRVSGAWPDGFDAPISPGTQVALPGARVEYYNTDAGIRWDRELDVVDDTGEFGNALLSLGTRFEGGRRYAEQRNAAVYGPGFGVATDAQGWVGRRGDTIRLIPNVVNDRLDWFNVPLVTDQLRVTLDRNGRRVFDGAFAAAVDVAPGDASYRLGVELTRHQPATLSTSVSCVWTFRSGTVRGDGSPLPLSAVRFLPALDNRNTAPAGRPFAVPLEIKRQGPARPVRTLRVEVSYDDGRTWRTAPVIRHDQAGVVRLDHPAGPGYVSLRAQSTDTAGNTVQETIIRAYRIA